MVKINQRVVKKSIVSYFTVSIELFATVQGKIY